MVEEFVPFGSRLYFLFLSLLIFGRLADFISTWLATPNLLLEANPIAKKLGWRLGLIVNFFICLFFAMWPLPSVVIATTSVLVAARNFQSAWLMRSLGENEYRYWMSERMASAPRFLFLFCLLAQTLLYAILGSTLMYFSQVRLVPLGVGMGLVTYSVAVFVYSALSVWRMRAR